MAEVQPLRTLRYDPAVVGSLDDVKRVRKAHGGTVNDVVLAAVAASSV